MLGLYAVMSYLVAQRVREIGVRVALGATSGDVTRLALPQAVKLTAAGLAPAPPLVVGHTTFDLRSQGACWELTAHADTELTGPMALRPPRSSCTPRAAS